MIEHSPIANLHVTSSFGHHVQKPFVAITTHGKELQVQLSPREARALAMHLLQAAAAAESDAFLITFLRKKIGDIDHHLITSILHDCKNWREQNGE